MPRKHEVEELERHEYNSEEIKRIVKKGKKKTKEEADITEAIHDAEEIIPTGKPVKIVTETYHHVKTFEEIKRSTKPSDKKRRSHPGDARLQLTKEDRSQYPKSEIEIERQEYSEGQLDKIVKKKKRSKVEEEIAEAVQEAHELAPAGHTVKVVLETEHHKHKRISDPKPKAKHNQIVPTSRKKPDLRDKSYKAIFENKLLPPLGFYRRDEKYLAIRNKYEAKNDGRGVRMADKYWIRQKNYNLRHLFVWPPKLFTMNFFWSFGYYIDAHSTTHRRSISLDHITLHPKKESHLSDSDDDRLIEYDDEVLLRKLDGKGHMGHLPWQGDGQHQLTEAELREFNSKPGKIDISDKERRISEKDGTPLTLFSKNELNEFNFKEMLLFPWELDSSTIKKLNKQQKADYREVVDFCNHFIGTEEKRLDNIRTHMGHTEFKDFLIMREKKKKNLVKEFRSLLGKDKTLLREGANEMSQGHWDEWKLKAMLILEYGAEFVNALSLPENKGKEIPSTDDESAPADKKKQKRHSREGAETDGKSKERKQRMSNKEGLVDDMTKAKEKKKMSSKEDKGDDAPVERKHRRTSKAALYGMSKDRKKSKDPAENRKEDRKTITWKNEDPAVSGGDNPNYDPKKMAPKKQKSVDLKVAKGEGEKETIGKIRRGTKYNKHKHEYEDEDDSDAESSNKDVVILPGLTAAASEAFIRGQSEVKASDQTKFVSHRLRWARFAREPNAKEAELWNSLPNNPKLMNDTMYVALLPKDVEKADLKELFPRAKISIEEPFKNSFTTYATVTFPNYELCRSGYERVRNVTYDDSPVVGVPKHFKNSEHELRAFLRYCKL